MSTANIATVQIKSVSAYSAGRYCAHEFPKLEKEAADAHDRRTCRNRLHVVNGKRVDTGENATRETYNEGEVIIPPMAFKNCLSEAAKYANIKTEGKGTFTKHFEAGILVCDGMRMGVKASQVPVVPVHVPSDGRRGGTSRVMRYFPTLPEWGGTISVHILDPKITKEIFQQVFTEAGRFIGLGTHRPRNNGVHGRFFATVTGWVEQEG